MARIFTEEHREKLRQAHLGKKLSEEHILKIVKANTGKKRSEATKLKLSIALKGNKNSKGLLGIIHSIEQNKKHSLFMQGRKLSDAIKFKISLSLLGNKNGLGYRHSEKSKLKIGLASIGEKNCHWKGGITPINKVIRHSTEYKNWRSEVFKRDYWTCQICEKKKGIKIRAHHIKLFKEYPELRFEISNGITLCKECHENSGLHNKEATA